MGHKLNLILGYIDLLTLFNSTEILMLTVCKCQKWTEQIKVCFIKENYRPNIESCHTGEVLNQKINKHFFYKECMEVCMGSRLDVH